MNAFHILIPFLRREDGVTSVEYSVMLAFILVVVIIGVTIVGDGGQILTPICTHTTSSAGF